MSVKVGLLGFGGIAKAHYRAYKKLENENAGIDLVAICDINPEQFEKAQAINIDTGEAKLDLAGKRLYTDVYEMLACEELDMIDICLPTYLHAEYAVKMLKAGKHVLCEKPMALSSEDCFKMIETAKETGKKLMIGQCLRFEPLYTCLKDFKDSGELGNITYMFLDRLGALPRWGFEGWFRDDKRSGGCALDLHIHDVDMIRFLLGEPDSVCASARDGVSRWQLIHSNFTYKDVPVVSATGSWYEAPNTGFKMTYRVGFEKAEVILEGGKVTVYPMDKSINGGDAYVLDLPAKDRMAEEIRYLANAIKDPDFVNVINTPESAMASVSLVEKLRESADLGSVTLKIN
jgi:predicted dehydrogenase